MLDKGGKPASDPVEVWFGATVAARGEKTMVTAVSNGSPAEKAGVSPGDELLALDGLRGSPGSLDLVVRRHLVKDKVDVAVFRGD